MNLRIQDLQPVPTATGPGWSLTTLWTCSVCGVDVECSTKFGRLADKAEDDQWIVDVLTLMDSRSAVKHATDGHKQ